MCKLSHGLLIFGFVISLGLTNPAAAQLSTPSTAITYQGYLQDSSAPADGIFCFEFQVYDAEIAGAAVSPVLQPCNVAVDKGRFSVDLDFGADVFNGEPRWLEIKVVSGGNTITLSPRQKINPAPTALYAQKAGEATTATVAGNGVPAGSTILTSSATPPDGYVYTEGKLVISLSSWVTKAAVPFSLGSGFSGGMINGKFYVVRGLGTYEYNLDTDTWTTKASQPAFCFDSGSAVLNGKLYVVGGQTGNGESDVLRVYDPVSNLWEILAPCPSLIFRCSGAAVGGKLYIFGGNNASAIVNTTYIYDPAENTWAQGAPMPAPNRWQSAIVVGNDIHLIGGLEGNTHFVYHTVSNSWTTLPAPPSIFAESAGVLLSGKIHLLGGDNVDPATQHYIYDPETMEWTTGRPLPAARNELMGGLIDANRFVVVGPDWQEPCIYTGGVEYYLHIRQ